MKILIITQYFWPENFRINDLVEEYDSREHELTILTGYPNYPSGKVFPEFKRDPESYSKFISSRVIRVPIFTRGNNSFRLALNYISYVFSSIVFGTWSLKNENFDVIFVYEPSPITVGITAIWFKKMKNAPIIFWTLDLWPESLRAVGVVKSEKILSLIGKVVKFIYNRCDLILAQSNSFIKPIKKYCSEDVRIEYFPSWSESLPITNELASEVDYSDDTFNILFTGNIGEAQDFPSVLDAVEILKNENIRWIIVGNGRRKNWLEKETIKRGLTKQVILLGEFPINRMTSFYNHSQALLVSLKRDYFLSLVIPGKVQSYLMSGLPILGMVQGETEQVIKNARAGFTCIAGDGKELAKIVKKMALTSNIDRKKMAVNGKNFASQEFDRTRLLKKLEKWMIEYSNN